MIIVPQSTDNHELMMITSSFILASHSRSDEVQSKQLPLLLPHILQFFE
jgi:hypothetical protein